MIQFNQPHPNHSASLPGPANQLRDHVGENRLLPMSVQLPAIQMVENNCIARKDIAAVQLNRDRPKPELRLEYHSLNADELLAYRSPSGDETV
jgi:hypothetical protein